MRQGTLSVEYGSWLTRFMGSFQFYFPSLIFRSPSRGTYRYTLLRMFERKSAHRCDSCGTVVFRGDGRVYPW